MQKINKFILHIKKINIFISNTQIHIQIKSLLFN